jgi:integrase
MPDGSYSNQAAPLSRADIMRIRSRLHADPLDFFVYTFVLFAQASVLRISEYTDSLTWAEFATDFSWVFLRRAKSGGPAYVLIPSDPNPDLNPRLWLSLLHARQGRPSGKAFALFGRPVSASMYTDRLRDLARRAQVPWDRLSGHSLRRGGASDMAAAPVPVILQHGRWKRLESVTPYFALGFDDLQRAISASRASAPSSMTLAKPSNAGISMERAATQRLRRKASPMS